MSEFPTLAGQLLIAMPALNDPNFENSVTLICEHNPEGAMGITINRPTDLTHDAVFSQLSEYEDAQSVADRQLADSPVLLGGPVGTERGFVLHREAGDWDATLSVTDAIHVTMSRDIVSAMLSESVPTGAVMALGYAGWEAEQLEREIRDNAWLTTQATAEIVFDAPFEARWELATRALGISPEQLSSGPAGNA
ncbi:MAG: YqgE/AlgH family protein [Pseudomonadota bacterium]